jgi:surface protein
MVSMNEINFGITDIEEISLSMDVGVKKIYPAIENLEVTPKKEKQEFNHEDSYGYDKVVVNSIPNEYIIPSGTLPITENKTYDVTEYSKVSASVYPAPNLQNKELTINENGTHKITADDEFDGLNEVSVTVDAIENLTEELETYNNELTAQEAKISGAIELIKNKMFGEAGKYKPNYISFYRYPYDSLEYEIENIDGSNLKSLYYSFSSISKITNLDLSKLDVRNVTDVSYAFYGSKFTNILLPKFLNAENMTYAFYNCTNLLSVSFEDAGKEKPITNVQEMFNGCSNLESVNLGNAHLNTNTLYRMFYNCKKLKSVDMSQVTCDKTINQLPQMFDQCASLEFLDIRNLFIWGVSNAINAFRGVPANCVIIVKDASIKNVVLGLRSDLKNVKTVAEWEAEQ